ncbi:60S ribosomal protein L31 [Rhizophagus clarus]|uniref:60S ribosomal protein L31 n=1 Tax=Rhizophagus clarus TaxID=94130 RepID=A0A8H3LE20_9GLOM|nr:60S ribosomal protein L31 [Rhizophagus clarus]
MLGTFRATLVACGGLLWKNPSKMSRTRKANVRKRLRAVDAVIEAVDKSGDYARSLPKESEMLPRDKYTVFSRKHKGYRKSLHKVPKFTKVTIRRTPPGF